MAKTDYSLTLSIHQQYSQTHCVATSFNFDSFLPDRINLAPVVARTYAKCSPIPDDAPVIQITFPLNVPK